MDREIKQWKLRVEKRNAEAAKEKAVRDTIFAELKQEFGYEIDPEDPMFKVMHYMSCSINYLWHLLLKQQGKQVIWTEMIIDYLQDKIAEI